MKTRSKQGGLAGTLITIARVFTLTLLVLFVLTTAAAVFLMSPAGLPVVLPLAKSYLAASGSTLSTTGQSGSLYGGVSFDSLTWTDDATTITLSEVETAWSLSALLSRQLRINELLIDRVEIKLPPAPINPPPREAIVLPDSIALPIELELQRARVRELLVHPGAEPGSNSRDDDSATRSAPIVFKDLGLSLRYRGAAYSLDDIKLVSPWLNVTKAQLSRRYPALSCHGPLARPGRSGAN